MVRKKIYTTDGKVKHLSKDEDINEKLSKIIGPKFIEYIINITVISEFINGIQNI